MRLRCLAVALTLLATFASDSWGQPKQPPSQSKQSAQPPAPDQRGTEQVPLAVKILPAIDAKEKADKEDRERQEKAKIDEKLAFETQRIADYTDRLSLFTIFLFGVAALQAALFTWQLLLIQSSARDTKKAAEAAADAADAAKLNAQAIVDAERARIYVEANGQMLIQQIERSINYSPADTHEQQQVPMDQGRVEVTYIVKNYGRTPAIIKEISHQLIVTKTLPDLPRETSPVDPFPISHFLARETEAGIVCNFESVFTVKDARDVFGGFKTVWLYGYIAYDDTFGWGREFNYVWHYTGGMNAFHLYGFGETKSRERHKDHTG
jgi:hypothetical protein